MLNDDGQAGTTFLHVPSLLLYPLTAEELTPALIKCTIMHQVTNRVTVSIGSKPRKQLARRGSGDPRFELESLADAGVG